MPIDKAPIDTAVMLIITDGGAPYAVLNQSCRSRCTTSAVASNRLGLDNLLLQ
jgi:hypothetical protein